jgi:hypothetical protein
LRATLKIGREENKLTNAIGFIRVLLVVSLTLVLKEEEVGCIFTAQEKKNRFLGRLAKWE